MMNLCINNIYFELNYQFVNSILWILLLDDFILHLKIVTFELEHYYQKSLYHRLFQSRKNQSISFFVTYN